MTGLRIKKIEKYGEIGMWRHVPGTRGKAWGADAGRGSRGQLGQRPLSLTRITEGVSSNLQGQVYRTLRFFNQRGQKESQRIETKKDSLALNR